MGVLLIVDDSKITRLMFGRHVRSASESVTIREAGSGAEALEKWEGVDHFFLDYNMPGMTGLELAEQLISQSVLPKQIVLVTANTQSAVQKRAADQGVRFAAKPLTPSSVRGLLEEMGVCSS